MYMAPEQFNGSRVDEKVRGVARVVCTAPSALGVCCVVHASLPIG